ncbi:hypothetical protein E1B28_013015 [Marasmius oreades]|uniref:Fucose-specific lectin n=1 Tax=Marasmius oreades TaxID=181124 RepID=A0A9P7RPT2_9AGAR|nr:uncharacterized protein E1B28_013015 [Marasmius oreades]KAG7087036.1 hypothetical protein E1B28_013015 [Marasmius oreades]
MVSSKSLFLALPFLAHCTHAAPTNSSQTANLAATFPNVPAIQDVAVVQGANNHPAFLFYQDVASADLIAATVSEDGSEIINTESIVPNAELFIGGPIAAVTLDASELSVFYVNQDTVISEVRRDSTTGEWTRGSACPECIDNQVSFKILRASKILFPMWTSNTASTAEIRLVFVPPSSTGDAVTVSEAERQNGVWSLHPLVTSQNTPAQINTDAFGDIIAIQGADNKPSFLLYRDFTNQAMGDLKSVTITDAFSVGHVAAETSIVPANGMFEDCPLAVVQLGQGASDLGDIRVFYGNADFILSEIRWTGGSGWVGGSDCPECIENQASFELFGRSVLYAMGTEDSQTGSTEIRLGFETGSPDNDGDFGKIVEVVSKDGVWSPST